MLTWTNERRKLRDLAPWENNPRYIKDAQAERLLESFNEFGQVLPVCIGPDNEIYDGHQRRNVIGAADEYGLDYEIDVRVSSRSLTERERQKLTVYLHKGATGDWDWDTLANSFDFSDLVAWGFDEDQLLGMDFTPPPTESADAEPQIDKAAELQEKWQTATGQLWRIGEHRLICGDCTDPHVVARVMGGEKADMLFTSPPYAQQRDYTDASKEKTQDWDALMRGVFSSALCADDCQILVNLGLVHDDGEWVPYWEAWIGWMRECGWRRFAWYVWDQGPGLPGDWSGRLAPAFEFVFHFNRRAKKPNKTKETIWGGTENHGKGLRSKDGSVKGYSHAGQTVQDVKIADSVIRVMRHKARGIEVSHPAVFAVDFAKEVAEAFTKKGDLVYEPFAGSGTTGIACNQLGRRCRMVEIDPKYCAVILERFKQIGITPELIE